MTTSINALRLGLIVNPLAGVGGPAGLKGSDSRELVEQAINEGALLRAPARATRCLSQLAKANVPIQLLTCADLMGEVSAHAAGLKAEIIVARDSAITTAHDTRSAALQLIASGIDLLLFVGGDGTARDIYDAVGAQVPVLGIPAGVKMQSGVFALSPEAACEVILQMLRGELVDLRLQEVRDIDETAFRQGQVKSRFYGEMLVPQCGQFLQQTKQGGQELEVLVLDDIAADLLERLEDDVIYLVGAGTTPRVLMELLGLENTLLGIDVVVNQQLLYQDVSGPALEALLAESPQTKVVAILSVTGQQGALLGRGNQQLTPTVLRRVGRENLWVLATKTKLRALAGRPLLIDSNDVALDREWRGYLPVITGYHDTVLYPVGLTLNGDAPLVVTV